MQGAGIPITREEYLYIGYFGQPCVRSSWCEDARSSGLTTPSPPAEKATDRQDQAGKKSSSPGYRR
jgi:hypothetical protein